MQGIKNIPIVGSNNRTMGVDIFYQDSNARLPVVIYVHGFNGFKDWGDFDLIATHFAKAGFFFVKMNLSHNGTTIDHPDEFIDLEAFGNNNYTKELFDVGKIIDWICDTENPFQKNINTSQITLIGHSRGGGIAILKASHDSRIQSLITWASVSECKTPWGTMSPDKIADWKKQGAIYYTNKRTHQKLPIYFQLYEDFLLHQKEYDLQDAISKLNIPILICHGTKDDAVPFENANRLSSWSQSATLFLVESDHVFGRKHPNVDNVIPQAMQEVIEESVSFLKSYFK